MKTSPKDSFSRYLFLISFLPAMAYWYLEENYPIHIAISGGLFLAILEISFEKLMTKHVHTLSKFNFYLILLLGSISLIGNEGIWFKLQPFFTGLGIGCFLIYRDLIGNGLMWEMMVSLNRPLPPKEVWQRLETHIGLLFVIYGIFMGTLAVWAQTSTWLFYKTIGFYITFFIFSIFEVVLLRTRMKRLMQNEYKRAILSRF